MVGTADPMSAADRIYRACQRDGGKNRIVFLDDQNQVRSLSMSERLVSRMLERTPGRVVGVYNHAIDVEDIAADITWSCKKNGVSK